MMRMKTEQLERERFGFTILPVMLDYGDIYTQIMRTMGLWAWVDEVTGECDRTSLSSGMNLNQIRLFSLPSSANSDLKL